ncbi:MAG: hypothetical protein KAR11_08025 [Phycisphaerae bacterium]|nr:hypothetical protein [Phycisphaerae bacterium]
MCSQTVGRKQRVGRDESIHLSPLAAVRLRSAMKEMDLLLQCPHEEAGLRHLVELLQNLRVVRREIV